ncbi:uncharacterized protein LOC127875244 [Dreissena polymorpha]|uniref:Uncharacterized protein n=1 Tax=Dreissena polymorpha TaxID=45954 RepID=A0A9D4L8T0_DREPO|nr:uncharacterized protein LOC127875244 [Dreissena polymorpha]KAH3853309.1 hypothetical protein DPMN_095831 [Dreissena polymorpha]
MSATKAHLLETVIEDLDGEKGLVSRKLKDKAKSGVRNEHAVRSAKSRKKSKKFVNIVIKVPSAPREENENKIFPKGLESRQRSFDDIKQLKTNGDDLNQQTVGHSKPEMIADANNNIVTDSDTGQDVPNLNETDKENAKTKDCMYEMFSRTNTDNVWSSQDTIKTSSVSFVPSIRGSSERKKIERPKSVGGWTKRELDLFLPRKTFFSVHDKTLVGAGMDTNSEEERNRRPEWRKILRMHTMDELYPPEKKTNANSFPTPFAAKVESESEDEGLSFSENVQTSMSADAYALDSGSSGIKKMKQSAKKGDKSGEKEEYKPLFDYLKYIHENPDEYINQSKYSRKNVDHKHPDTMVRLGRAYRRGHHGAVRNNIFLHAISGLKVKMTDNSTTNQRTGRVEKVASKKTSEDIAAEKAAAHDETDLEKLKSKTERWLTGLSTLQFMKAKEFALKDLGEEDINFSKWWVAFQSCHYLRMPSYYGE